MGTDPCRAGVWRGPSPPCQPPCPGAPVQAVLCPPNVPGVPTCKRLGLGAGMGGTEPCLSRCPNLVPIQKTPHPQFRERDPSKIHGHSLETPFPPSLGNERGFFSPTESIGINIHIFLRTQAPWGPSWFPPRCPRPSGGQRGQTRCRCPPAAVQSSPHAQRRDAVGQRHVAAPR